MYCSNCGEKTNQGDVFCSNCGASLKKVEEPKKEKEVSAVEEPKKEVVVPVVEAKPTPVASPSVAISSKLPTKSGAATASMVLGIIAVVFVFITLFISACFLTYNKRVKTSYYDYGYDYDYDYDYDYNDRYDLVNDGPSEEQIIIALAFGTIPAIMSITGLLLGLCSRRCQRNGTKIAGIVLNAVSLVLLILQTGIILGMV